MIKRRRFFSECAPEQDLAERALDQVGPAHHLRDVHRNVVRGAGELIARYIIFSPDQEIAEVASRDRLLRPSMAVVEANSFPVGDAEAPVHRDILTEWRQRCVGGRAKLRRIYWFVGLAGGILVRRGGGLEHIAPRMRAGEYPAGRMQLLEHGAIEREPFALAVRRKRSANIGAFLPGEPKPMQILDHRLGKIQPITRGIKIVAAQHERAPGVPGALRRDPKRSSVSEVQMSRRRGRESAAIAFSGHFGRAVFCRFPDQMNMAKLLCVYCSSSRTLDPKYYALAGNLGREMVARGWGLVYGGGNAGLMGAVARGVKEAGGHVVGVIPEFMKVRELAFHAADELITVETMRDRKRLMEERASAFLALPGGIGTLEEIAEIMTLRYINVLHKPVVLLNQDGFYDDLLRFFNRLVHERFASAAFPQLFAVAPTIADLWPILDEPSRFQADAIWQSPERPPG